VPLDKPQKKEAYLGSGSSGVRFAPVLRTHE